jgi:hypothetical protein
MAITENPADVPPEDDGYPPPPEYNDTVQEIAPEDVPPQSDAELAYLEQQQAANREILAREATDVEPGPGIGQVARDAGPSFGENPDAADEAASAAQVGKKLAQEQAANQVRVSQPSSADWRVRLQLAQSATYLYKASTDQRQLGILAPLAATDGVIFPYTPTIDMSYQAKYQNADLVHSNYRGYFYQSSSVDAVNIKAIFTAQDTYEASYLLAVIHFFRSITKMFYGQDSRFAGTPPPLVFLSGLGQYQFNKHPCVVSNFQYNLPKDVDYIRANGFNNIGINMENRLNKVSGPGPGGLLGFLSSKLGINGLRPGGLPTTPDPSVLRQNVNTTEAVNSTYVPTKMEIGITLLPIQTRNQVSQQFSLQKFANGSLLKDGFW